MILHCGEEFTFLAIREKLFLVVATEGNPHLSHSWENYHN